MNVKDLSNEMVIVDQSEGGIFYLQHGAPSKLIRWHSHEHYELHLIVSTRGKTFIGDYIGDFKPGQLILTGPYVPHNWVTDKGSHDSVPLRDMVVLFNHKSFEDLVRAFPEAKEIMEMLQLSQAGLEFLNFDMKEAQDFFSRLRDSKGMGRLLIFLEFMNKLNSWSDKKTLSTAKYSNVIPGAIETKISDVVKYITEHYQEDLSLDKVANLVNMSTSSFSRHFQKATCNKYVEFVNRVRVGRACVLLSETEKHISTICFDVGFKNITNFNRQFYRLKNKTPGEYRKETQGSLGKNKPVTEKIFLNQ